MKIVATLVKAHELKPGDLFSTESQVYWDHFDPAALGQKVYIRTEAPTPAGQADEEIYKITIKEN